MLSRCVAFENHAKQAGFDPIVYVPPADQEQGFRVTTFDLEHTTAWVKALPRPCGVMCFDDIHAHHLLKAARAAEVVVPEEMFVIGVGNEQLMARFGGVRFSSMKLPGVEIGFRAAKRLDELLNGQSLAPTRQSLAPAGIVHHEGSDFFAIGDPLVAQAMQLMRRGLRQRITIDSICGSLNCSRRLLEYRFRTATGLSPWQQMRDMQINQACALLRGTDLKISVVAISCGFRDARHFATVTGHSR